ncbi:MAG: FtsW/RodA/SpoVE family cell cycle protein [Erysipelotrichaceae bacterium]|nr:FtsW/RodA/SpoVE family cell cycle protein [Erysipelotrichaceae bacterium]
MQKKIRFLLGDIRISIAVAILAVFGFLMIASAEMGNSAGDTSYLTSIMVKQAVFTLLGLTAYFILMHFPYRRFSIYIYWFVYGLILLALLACRLFGGRNGAYGWIDITSNITVQPSEFAKVFMIVFAAKLLSKDRQDENLDELKRYAIAAAVYFLVIAVYQHDFGSAVVLFVICYCITLVPGYKQLRLCQLLLTGLILLGLALALLAMSEPVTELLKKHADNYMVGRFLAAADPFLYQYDNGYHLIMSLVSFANGGWFGLGYGNSIHKYMNFPNPSNDFILPVIVEELGAAGFIGFIIVYGLMLFPIISVSIHSKDNFSRMVLLGVSIYFIIHFILNVGGVSGLIPLTGVPILLISSGGSSLLAALAALGIAQNEIEKSKEINNEDHRGKIQENAD